MVSPLARVPAWVADPLARAGLVDRETGREAVRLGLPVMVTGGMRTLLRAVDLLFVSLALGPAAVAGLELGFQYYFIGFGIALGLSSGTISVVARLEGAGERARADLATEVSLLLALSVTLPLTAGAWYGAEAFVDALTDDPATIRHGGAYLRWVMVGVTFRFWGMIAGRALAGVGDTRTPMLVRVVTVPVNAALNALLIFGLGPFPALGAAGAGVGTSAANALAGVTFLVLLASRRWDVGLRAGGPHWDGDLAREILRVGSPLAGLQVVRTLGRFPFLWILAALGTSVVSAYAVGRQVMLLALMPAWGYATAASTMVGQSIGAGDMDAAGRKGWDTTRVAFATQVTIGLALVLLAEPIVGLFGAAEPGLHVAFLRVFGASVPAYSVGRTLRGALRGAGDPNWPLAGAILGTVVRLPVAATALAPGVLALHLGGWSLDLGLGLGVAAAMAAIVVDMYLRAGIVAWRFRSGAWRGVAEAAEAARVGRA